MSNIVEFPRVNGAQASARTMPALTAPELRARAVENYYSDERRRGVDQITAWERSESFARDLERIAKILAEG